MDFDWPVVLGAVFAGSVPVQVLGYLIRIFEVEIVKYFYVKYTVILETLNIIVSLAMRYSKYSQLIKGPKTLPTKYAKKAKATIDSHGI